MEAVPDMRLEGEGIIPFFVARLKDSNYMERHILRAGVQASYQKFEREHLDSDFSVVCTAEGRLKHDSSAKSIIIYSSSGPAHKTTYRILKEKFPQYNSIIWRDG